MKIKRRKVTDKRDETFFGKLERSTVSRQLVYKITVENLKDRPVDLDLMDHLPVSKTDKIDIKDVRVSPPPTATNVMDREGVLQWRLTVKPGARQEILMTFTVTHPKDISLQGF